MRLDDDMKRVVREQSLGFVATVCPDGTPNLSPKGTTVVWDDEHLVFLHLHSPRTVANLAANPAIELNVVDPIVRKGYRFKGRAKVLTGGKIHDRVLTWFARDRGTASERVTAVVLVRVDAAEALISPVYDSGVSEAAVAERWRRHHLGLAERRPPISAADNTRSADDWPDFLCDLGALDAGQKARHGELGSQLVASMTRVEELPDGYAFVLSEAGFLGSLAEWVSLERLCCPFLDFNIIVRPATLRLELGGPPGVKAFLLAEFPTLLADG